MKNDAKDEIRQKVYARLRSAKAARFPFPIEGRIPNFVGAEAAAKRLRSLPLYQKARAIKANPDAPQLPVRAMALADGKTVYMPSPRLRGAFLRIDPADVPAGEERRAASLSHCQKYGVDISIDDLARYAMIQGATQDATQDFPIDLIVTGSVAVTRSGARAGKGEGYADLEYAILRELGAPHLPVVSTVHSEQIVSHIPVEPHDLSLDYIITPEEMIQTENPLPKPQGFDWSLLTAENLKAMPILEELRLHKESHLLKEDRLLGESQHPQWQSGTVPDIVGPNLHILFIGINPGKKSAEEGHNFAGPGNHFWRLLFDAGLTPTLLTPREERLLLNEGLGITNIVSRASRSEADLSWDEMIAGGSELIDKIRSVRPRVVAFLGKNVYRAYAGQSRSAHVEWGLQPTEQIEGIKEFVAPNPSARSTIPYAKRLDAFRTLKNLIRSPESPL